MSTTIEPATPARCRDHRHEFLVFADASAAVEALAQLIARRAQEAAQAERRFRIALAGGSTPSRLYARLAEPDLAKSIPWQVFEVFFGDERCVPATSVDSNLRMAHGEWLGYVPIHDQQVHAVDTTVAPAIAAEKYEAALGEEPLDLVLLGMGADGHVASLFPGGPELEARGRRVVASKSRTAPHDRVTLTLDAIRSAREVAFLALGPLKSARLARVAAEAARPVDAEASPAARVRPDSGRVRWFVDRAAASTIAPDQDLCLADFGMIGLAVMGRNLALNVADRGLDVAVWNLEPELTARAVAESGGRLRDAVTLPELVASIARPRRIMLMIRAGAPVDAVLDRLEPLLDEGDVVIDGGNSWFEDTRRREQRMARTGVHFVGAGVSGGEEGARHGPSLMPGGSVAAFELVRPVLEAIAAHTEHGSCVTHVGGDGAGHFVKMVHNGIEYADMQFIAEAYHVLSALLGLDPPALAAVFSLWNEGPLASFLIEITAEIFRRRDPSTGVAGSWLIDSVLDKAAQKGTGRWTAEVALSLGVAVPSIAAAIDARVLSSQKRERERLAQVLAGPSPSLGAATITVDDVRDALYAAKVGAYAQGMALIQAGAERYGWSIDRREIARIWTGGCIIRARFLETMMRAYEAAPELSSLLADEAIRAELAERQDAWRRVVSAAVTSGVPVPGMAASLAYYDSLRTARLPQNLVQAQRDAFGAHTYQRTDDPDGEPVHSHWLQ